MLYDLAITAPEIKYYLLYSNDRHVEIYVTDADLNKAFSPEDVMKLKSNRHKFFNLEDVN